MDNTNDFDKKNKTSLEDKHIHNDAVTAHAASSVGKRPSTNDVLSKALQSMIMYILRENTSEGSPMSVPEILKQIKSPSFNSASMYTINTSKPTVAKAIYDLYNFCCRYEEIFSSIYGGTIARYSKNKYNMYTECSDVEENNMSYYAFHSSFSQNEIVLLQSCISTNPYLTYGQQKAITDKILNLAPCIRDNPSAVKLDSKSSFFKNNSDAAKLIDNISALTNYIGKDIRIKIQYGRYELKNGSKPFLTPTKYTADGKPLWQNIDPVGILEGNGFYYVVAHNDHSKSADDVIAYRIDRIMSIKPLRDSEQKEIKCDEDVISYKKSFSAAEYLKAHPVMYAGKTTSIVMLVHSHKYFAALNSMMDTFGTDRLTIRPAGNDEAQKYLGMTPEELTKERQNGSEWYHVLLSNHALNGTLLWARQHIDNVLIISPVDIAKELYTTAWQGIERYEAIADLWDSQ